MNIVHFSLLNSGSWCLGFLAGFEACPAEPVRPGGSSPRKTELVRPGLEMWQEARQGLAGSLMKMTLLCKTFHFQRSSLIFQGLLMGTGGAGQRPSTFVAEVPLEWVIPCLGRRQHWHFWVCFFPFLNHFNQLSNQW